MKLRSLKDVSVRGKRVLVRAGFNVPLDERGRIADDSRLRRSLPTIRWLLGRGGRTILCSHLGRPEGRRVRKYSLAPVSRALSRLLRQRVALLPDCIGPRIESAAAALKNGQAVLLENLRFHPEEELNGVRFARQLARLADLYVDDAFENIHRSHASMVAVTRFLPSYAGFLVAEEVATLGRTLTRPSRPFVTVIGGAKIATKIGLIRTLLPRVDYLLLGGALANTMLRAQGIQVGRSLIEPQMVATIRRLELTDPKLKIPVDVVVAKAIAPRAPTRRTAVGKVGADEYILDIGPDTIALFRAVLAQARTIVWNGPVGYAELPAFRRGTLAVGRAAAASSAQSIVGGGETVDALRAAHLLNRFSFVSTGGGAMLEFLEGKPLPALKRLLR